jgi:predicted AlkP superfamily phosphohydrolase/phosphomutase
MGFLYVNVVGKGSYGIVQPGEEYEALLADLISRFREIRHPKTGEKLLQDVVRGEHVYPAADNGIPVPDLVLIPVDGYGFSFSLSDAEPQISEEGTHRHNGVVMIKGKSIKKPASEFGPQLIDVAPTIIHLLGLSVPTDMDGKVWEEIFRDHSPVSYEESDKSFVQVAQSYDSKDSSIIEQRLKGLGYL